MQAKNSDRLRGEERPKDNLRHFYPSFSATGIQILSTFSSYLLSANPVGSPRASTFVFLWTAAAATFHFQSRCRRLTPHRPSRRHPCCCVSKPRIAAHTPNGCRAASLCAACSQNDVNSPYRCQNVDTKDNEITTLTFGTYCGADMHMNGL